MSRVARVERVTKETRILVELDLDGSGVSEVGTGVQIGRASCRERVWTVV